MTVRRLAAVDAQMYWMSKQVASDQFLLYAFDGAAPDLDVLRDDVLARASACADLGLRITDAGFWTYPVWAPRTVEANQVVGHDLAENTWAGCLDAVAGLVASQLDPRDMTWRLHVFADVDGVPGCSRAGSVAVVQISHALGDGIRSSALAAYLFGRDEYPPAVLPGVPSVAALPVRGVAAALAHRRLVRDTAAGLAPAPAVSRPVLGSNTFPRGRRHLRTVLVDRGRVSRSIPGRTVTVAVLSAISGALSGYLQERGEDPSQLAAEVPMAKSGPRQAFNHFGNVGVGLYPGQRSGTRARLIADELDACRRRTAHPARRAEDAASACVPAPLLRWGTSQFDPEARWSTVTGHTVVSSVNRGAKDLRLGAAPVVLTTGCPGLSPMMGVTHGVHGIGDTITISVHAAESAMDDVDSYVERLQRELS